MHPKFASLERTDGIEIFDPIETRRFIISTPAPVHPEPIESDQFDLPVSAACAIHTDHLQFPYTALSYIRDEGRTIEVTPSTNVSLSSPNSDGYLFDVNAPLKLYFRIPSGMTVHADIDQLSVSLADSTRVEIGARSVHKTPAGTITTTDRLSDVSTAVAALSSALKTTSPERSWPTLRGHPPTIDRGDDLQIPDGIERPETGVTLVLPRNRERLYVSTPLTYYLGADIELVSESATPRLITETGFEYSFDDPFEQAVADVLTQNFVMDCMVRTAGIYDLNLHGRELVASTLPATLDDLYQRPLSERVEAYLSVPYSEIEQVVPTWHREAFVHASPDRVKALPYLCHDLMLVRPDPDPITPEPKPESKIIDEFTRSEDPHGGPPEPDTVTLPTSDVLEQLWVGPGIPQSGMKLYPDAYENRTTEASESIEIIVVCNDTTMQQEWDEISEFYQSRTIIPNDVNIRFDVSVRELRKLLSQESDFFHYIGHIDHRGFQCPDGFLDAREMPTTGVKTFLLNACQSLQQGEHLIQLGAQAGIVSFREVPNNGAITFGENIAKLLYHGFAVSSALTISRKHTWTGGRYIALGNPTLTLTQCENVVPLLYQIDQKLEPNPATQGVSICSYPSCADIGMTVLPYLQQDTEHYLPPGELTTVDATAEQLETTLNADPLIVDGGLKWSTDYFG